MKQTTTVYTDDLDGTPGAETCQLSIDGYTVDIDLAEASRSRLYAFLRPYLDAGRRTKGSKRLLRPTPPPATISGPVRSEIRLWWRKHPDGLPTWQARGAIPAVVQAAWQTQRGNT